MAPPDTVPGGNPVIEVPGDAPTLPMIAVAPVFVTVEKARTPKFPAVPSGTVVWAKEHAADKRNKLRVFKTPLVQDVVSGVERASSGRNGLSLFNSSPLRLRVLSDVNLEA